MCTVLKGCFCVLGNDSYCCHGWEDISDIWEGATVTKKSHVSRGWHPTNAVSGTCLFPIKYKSPPLGIEPRSPAWQAGILATILWRNQINCFTEIYSKYNILYSTIHLTRAITSSLRNSRYLYCAQVRSNLVRREWYGHCTKLFVVLLVMQGWSSRW